MAFSTLTINIIPNSTSNSATLTLTTSSLIEAQTYVQNLKEWVKDDAGKFYPRTAIISIAIS